jgi:Zn-dependent alcohol dehydrogenase
MRSRGTKHGGFNLVEALVATVILSSAVLTLGAIGTNALSGTRLHRHYEVAAALIDKQLSLIDYMGIDQFIQTGQMEGIVEELEPGYAWSVTTEYQNVDSLYLVEITVSWLEGSRPYRVTAQTMLNGTGAVTDTSTSTGTETGEQPSL